MRLLMKTIILLTLYMMSTFINASDDNHDGRFTKGPDACGECHEGSIDIWKKTHHAKTFKSITRSNKGRKISKKLGIKRIKSESECLQCHFTTKVEQGEDVPIAGVSCESCHGAGKNWIDIHSDFGGEDVEAEDESESHKIERYKKSEQAGMIGPKNLYSLAKNCFNCHAVANEKLVNQGEHPAGSQFELVRWSQGEIRHNIWYSKENQPALLKRQRMMYLLGQMLDLEYGLRGVAIATEKAGYAKIMAKRASYAKKRLKKIAQMISNPQINSIVKIASDVKLKLNNKVPLLKAADAIAKQSAIFAEKQDGSNLSAIDKILPAAKKYKGKVYVN